MTSVSSRHTGKKQAWGSWEKDMSGKRVTVVILIVVLNLLGLGALYKACRVIPFWPHSSRPEPELELEDAVKEGDIGRVGSLIARGADQQEALNWAAYYGQGEICRMLLDAGNDPNALADDGYFPLIHAVFFGHTDVTDLLLTRGADLNQRTSDGSSALIAAVLGEASVRLVEGLIRAGAELEFADRSGYTALHRAVLVQRSDMVALLLKAGASPDATDGEGTTALHLAAGCGHPEIMKLLLDGGHGLMRPRSSDGSCRCM